MVRYLPAVVNTNYYGQDNPEQLDTVRGQNSLSRNKIATTMMDLAALRSC